jgi:iron complex transport system substrate-binding protein
MNRLIPTVLSWLAVTTPALALDCPEGQRAFTHAAGETCIPVDPQRIVTLQDQNALLPLLELGVVPVGSAGHILPDGSQIFRRTAEFDTSAVAFVGSYEGVDAEAVAALAPDLIVAGTWPEGQYETFSKIAPTIVFDPFAMPLEDALLQLADAVGRTDRALALEAELQAHAAALRDRLGDRLARTTLSFLSPSLDGRTFDPDNGGQVSGLAFRLLQPVRVPAQAALGPDEWQTLGFEVLPDHQGDVMFVYAYDAEAQGGEFDLFLADPLVATLPVVQAGQAFRIDGAEVVGSAWSRARRLMDRIAEVVADDRLNRDLVAE